MTQRFYNNARGELAGPVIVEDTVIVVGSPVGFPTSLPGGDWFMLTVLKDIGRYGQDVEVMKVTGVTVSGANLELVVERGQDGFSAIAHDMGEMVECRITAMTLIELLAAATGHTDTAIAALVDSSPGTLDTLNELAAALGDDPNFATTVTNQIATKLDATAYTAADILAKLLTVDGIGSLLDADLLDGKQGSEYSLVGHAHAWTEITDKPLTFAPSVHDHNSLYYQKSEFALEATANTPVIRDASADVKARLFRSTYTSTNATIAAIYTTQNLLGTDFVRPSTPAQVKSALAITPADIGALPAGAKAVDANLLDGIDSSQFLRSDVADIKSAGNLTMNDNVYLNFGTGNDAEFFCNGTHMYIDLNTGIGNLYIRDDATTRFTFDDAGHFTATGNITAYSDSRVKENIEVIPDALEKVLALSGYTFDRTDNPKLGRQTGVIAQEVLEVLPEAVQQQEDTGHYAVAYGNMVGLLIEAIKEQQVQIDELKQRIPA